MTIFASMLSKGSTSINVKTLIIQFDNAMLERLEKDNVSVSLTIIDHLEIKYFQTILKNNC